MTPNQEVMIQNIQLKLGVNYTGDGSTKDATLFITAYEKELRNFDVENNISNRGFPATRKQKDYARKIEDETNILRSNGQRKILGPISDYITNNAKIAYQNKKKRQQKWSKNYVNTQTLTKKTSC